MNPLRICNLNLINSSPYRSLKQLEEVSYEETSPYNAARKLFEGETDIALISLVEFLNHGDLDLLPFGIAAEDRVDSVRLLSKTPIEEIESIFFDQSSVSSVTLLRILIHDREQQVRYFRRDLTQPFSVKPREGVLVIGDRGLADFSGFTYQYDLAKLWFERFNLPFVFAVWAFRKGRLSRNQLDLLTRTFDLGVTHRLAFAREAAEEKSLRIDQIEDYVGKTIKYKFDERFKAGANEFINIGKKLNLFPETATLFVRLEDLFQETPKILVHNRRSSSPIEVLLCRAADGNRLSISEAIDLARNASLADLALAADERRQDTAPINSVSYIIDRNINYTNVCNVFCSFCAFYRAPESSGIRGEKAEGRYILTKDEIGKKISETVRAGGIQILLQGGLNPELGIEYYEDLFSWIKSNYPVNLHALSADEILHISKVSAISIEEVLQRLITSGLGSLPGGGAEILVDRVRRRIAKLKSNSESWLDVHRTAHRLGITSTATMMFGIRESWEDRILHLAKLRQLQDETGRFTAFITWPFQDENVSIRRGNTTAPEYLRTQAVSRLFLDNFDNVQSSWVTMGPSVGQVALSFGANDFGSVMFEENVVSAAGTVYCMNKDIIERHIVEAGYSPWARDVHYRPA
jgi:cyclic dehypoxanthinyl futalosine synthase